MRRVPKRAWLRISRALWLRRERYRWRRWTLHRSKPAGKRRDQLVAKWHRLWVAAHAMRMRRDLQLHGGDAAVARGIDVSSHQGAVAFDAVKAAGYAFVYLKATEGEGYVDRYFAHNVIKARAAGLKVGAYHFLRPRPGRSGAAEADDFVRQVKAAGLGKGDLHPVCDIEVSELAADATERYVQQFLVAVQAQLGVRPLIYTYPYFIRPWKSSHGTDLWIADYRRRPAPEIPGPWPRWSIWQQSSSAQVPGVRGDCDINFCPDIRRIIH